MSDTNTATKTAADFAPELQWLLDHPNLPAPRGFGFAASGGILAMVRSAEEVALWAEAIGAEVETCEYKGNTHHSILTFEPFWLSVAAIVAPEAVSA